jgi:putative holliday junction resolvase
VRIVGLDVSDARIGVAVADDATPLAHGIGVVKRVGGQRDLDAIDRLVGEPRPGRFVIGLPLNMDDSEGPQARKVRAFGDRLAAHFGLPVEFWDERLTTFAAADELRAASVPRRRHKGLLDQVAARLILEGYLARPQQ